MAAQLLAEDELTIGEIAERIGITPRALYDWRQEPEFRAQVEAIAKEIGDAAMRNAIGRRARRVRALQDRWLRMQRVIEERGADAEFADVPGWTTGLLVRDAKMLGGGESAELVNVFKVDAGLLRELREHEKQAAQELGQWVDRGEISGSMTHEHSISLPDDELAKLIGAVFARLGAGAAEPGGDGPGAADGPAVGGPDADSGSGVDPAGPVAAFDLDLDGA